MGRNLWNENVFVISNELVTRIGHRSYIPLTILGTTDVIPRSYAYSALTIVHQHFPVVIKYLIPKYQKKKKVRGRERVKRE